MRLHQIAGTFWKIITLKCKDADGGGGRQSLSMDPYSLETSLGWYSLLAQTGGRGIIRPVISLALSGSFKGKMKYLETSFKGKMK